ncbi:MAG: FliH/SctL family protein, partial [Oscillospiraceae bacterium]|nr:FliH/SctL family protein [Oscillospiraceae bacterium]
MFRIDRSLVNVSRHKVMNFDAKNKDKDKGKDEESTGDPDFDPHLEPDPELDSVPAHPPAPDPTELAEEMLREYISAAEQELQEKAEAVLNNAKTEAAQILIETRDEIEEEKNRGFQEGYIEGVAEGKQSYEEKTQEKIAADDKVLKNVLDEIYNEQERIKTETESGTIELAIEIVKKIIAPAEDELGTVFTSLIKNALRQMSSDGKIVIRVGPDEFERFFSSGAATIELDSGVTVSATVMKDLTMNEGDLIIDSDEGTVNAGIDS